MSSQYDADPAFMNGALTGPSSDSSTSTTTSTSTSSSTTSKTTTSTQTATNTAAVSQPSNAPSSSSGIVHSVYAYDPSTAGAIAFATLYVLQVAYHFYLSVYIPHIRKSVVNKHKYTIPLLIAAVLLTIGFSVRIASVSSEAGRASISLYALSTCCIIVAPIFICAAMYLMLAHLIRLCLPHGSGQNFLGLSPKWLGRIFISSDVVSFLLQGAGSAIGTSGNWMGARRDWGMRLLVNGLAAQLGTFTMFMVILLLFCMRVSAGKDKKQKTTEEREQDQGVNSNTDGVGGRNREFGFNPLVMQVVKGMWMASVLIEIRSIYRTVEFATGANGYLFTHEWPLWVFEAVPIWLALLLLGIYHPITWLQQKRRSAFLHEK